MRLIVLFLLATLTLPISTPAEEHWTNGNVMVKSVIWIPGIKGFYAEAGTYHDPKDQDCSPANLYQVAPTVTDLEASRILAMLLSAKATGSPVNVYTTLTCGPEGPYFTGLQINP